jgi:hypothetical protein
MQYLLKWKNQVFIDIIYCSIQIKRPRVGGLGGIVNLQYSDNQNFERYG